MFNTDQFVTARTTAALYKEIQELADTPLLKDKQAEGMSVQYRQTSILNRKYQLYFTRYRQGGIKVLRIYSSKRKPLTPNEILP